MQAQRDVEAQQLEEKKTAWIAANPLHLKDSTTDGDEMGAGDVARVVMKESLGGGGAFLKKLPLRGMMRVGMLGALIAVGVVLYPMLSPMVLERVGPLKAVISSEVQQLGDKVRPDASSSKAGSQESAGPRVYIKPSAAKLRAGPAMSAEVLGFVRRSSRLVRIGKKNGWVQIRVVGKNGRDGWVHGSLLSDKPTG
jgi:hypothetical protein